MPVFILQTVKSTVNFKISKLQAVLTCTGRPTMRFASVVGRFLPCTVKVKLGQLSIVHFTNSSLADRLYGVLQNNPASPENALKLMKPQLDTACVAQVLRRLSTVDHLLGLRFFVWAGVQTPYRHTSYTYTKACQMLGVARNPRVLMDLLDSYMVDKCVVGIKMFNVVFNMCKECKLFTEALSVLKKMPEFGVCPNTHVYNIVIRLLCDNGDADTARRLLHEMNLLRLYPDVVTYVLLIKGFCNVGRIEEASELRNLMKAHGCVPNVVVYSALLDGISKFLCVERAFELLDEMENEGGYCTPNVITYTSMIQSFCERGRLEDGFKVLDKMQLRGCSPNRVTVSVLLEYLCAVGRLKEAYELIERASSLGGVSYADCYSSLVLSLVRLKKTKDAEHVFKTCASTGLQLDGLASSMIIWELCSEKRNLDGFLLLEEIEKNEWLCTIDSEIYPVLLIGLCESKHTTEAVKVATFLIEKKIRLKSPYSEKVVECLKHCADDGLLARLLACT